MTITHLRPTQKVASLGIKVVEVGTRNGTYLEALMDPLGTVILARRTVTNLLRRAHELGAVWPTGDQYAALPHTHESGARTLHRTRGTAVHALIRRGGYEQVFPRT